MRILSQSVKTPFSPPGDFHAGVDLGQKRDQSVVAVVRKSGKEVYLVHLKRFGLGTPYGSVFGYLKLLNERIDTLHRILIDQTGVGEVFVEEILKSGLGNARGIMLSLPKKQEVMVYLRQMMEEKRVHIYYDVDLINELNIERYEYTKTGQIQYSHPAGTHDDRLWAFALAVYASRPEITEYHPVAATGRSFKPVLGVPDSWRPKFYGRK